MECLEKLNNKSAGSEAKLLESLVNRTVPMWWDDIDSLVILEKLTVLLYNKAKKITMQKDGTGSTVPVISVNYSKLIKGFKKLKMGREDFSRLFTRMLPIPFGKKTIGKKRIAERIEGRSNLENVLREVPKSMSVVLKLHEDYKYMTKDKLFGTIQDSVEGLDLDVRSEANFSVLLFTTGKILEHINLFEAHWPDIIKFFDTQMVPKYKELLIGNCEGIEAIKENPVTVDDDFWDALETIFKDAVSNPEEAQTFFKASYHTKRCTCGESVAISLCKAVSFSKLTLSSAALTHCINEKMIGCTGKSMRIGDSSSTCIHISKRKIPQRLLDVLNADKAADQSKETNNSQGLLVNKLSSIEQDELEKQVLDEQIYTYAAMRKEGEESAIQEGESQTADQSKEMVNNSKGMTAMKRKKKTVTESLTDGLSAHEVVPETETRGKRACLRKGH